tara:strand:+ start:354 stop:680 length:327 start_codon:yes stop_codon:yes gene_type:complete
MREVVLRLPHFPTSEQEGVLVEGVTFMEDTPTAAKVEQQRVEIYQMMTAVMLRIELLVLLLLSLEQVVLPPLLRLNVVVPFPVLVRDLLPPLVMRLEEAEEAALLLLT